ncbi:MAG: hypothetical protein JWQ88_2397 [Rhodoferax sp.]|nr:hypothetical protein [Rhodoferax sp.]
MTTAPPGAAQPKRCSLIAIIVPAHNAEPHIDACLESLVRAARHPALAQDDVQITVVLDRCSDRTGWLARSWGVQTMDVQAGHSAAARKAGADAALRAGARWIAFADADSVATEDWLAAQVAQRSDVVCDAVVDGALDTSHPLFEAANFGLSANAYQAASDRQAARDRDAVAASASATPATSVAPTAPVVARVPGAPAPSGALNRPDVMFIPATFSGGSGVKPGVKPVLQSRWPGIPLN